MITIGIHGGRTQDQQERPSGNLNRSHINPKAGVIRLVGRVRVDLLLNPLNTAPVALNVRCVGVIQARFAVAVTGEPDIQAVMVLTFGARGHIGIEIVAG